mmetsp:Transcript_15916/g.17674  ORF Transcript_15916/g.17674 Transcript_15916/m.17674 type:complete len:287 (+) Transcript_15916:114-974(+)
MENAPYNNPLLDPHVISVGGRPDDLPTYPLFKSRDKIRAERIEQAPHEVQFERPVPRGTGIRNQVPVNYLYTWSVVTSADDIGKRLPAFMTIWWWSTRYGATVGSLYHVYKYTKAIGMAPVSAEGSYRPKWTYGQFWSAYYRFWHQSKAKFRAGRTYKYMFWAGFAYIGFLSITTTLLLGTVSVDERLIPGLAFTPLLWYSSRMNKPLISARFWLWVAVVNTCSFIMISNIYGIPLKLGHRFNAPYRKLRRIEESPDFYLSPAGMQTVLDDPYYLREKHMGYTKYY